MIRAGGPAAPLALFNDGEAGQALTTETPHRTAPPHLTAPHRTDIEVGHALRRRVHVGAFEPSIAADSLERWGLLGIERVGMTAQLDRVWELRNAIAYDAAYVVVAESIECTRSALHDRRRPTPRRCTRSALHDHRRS